jgi:protein tyrosine/serine phosphatase
VHGIPNFAQVAPGIWRSGQPPPTAEAWGYLDSLGIKTIVKLNMPDEGNDDVGRHMGISVHKLGIQPAADTSVFDEVLQTFVEPDAARVDEAVKLIAAGGGVLVHCSHGQDRTGTVVGAWRVRTQGWTKTPGTR